MAVIGQDVGRKLIEALGLPASVKSIELRVAVNEIVTVKVEQCVERENIEGLVEVLKHYELQERS